jgi:hypothetical protein
MKQRDCVCQDKYHTQYVAYTILFRRQSLKNGNGAKFLDYI